MPPKPKDDKGAQKKAAPPVIRPPISESDLMYVPIDAIEGYQDRIESDVEWTLIDKATLYHRVLCMEAEIPVVTFTQALEDKIKKSIYSGLFNEDSGLTLAQNWELLLPILLWDNENFANEEGKVCFYSCNNITDNMSQLIQKAVKYDDRELLKRDFKMIPTLRLTDAKVTEIDSGLLEFQQLVTLTLCGNCINEIKACRIPPGVRSLELQANKIENVNSIVESLPQELLYLGVGKNFITNENLDGLIRLPFSLTVLDLSDNDIYHLNPLLDNLIGLPNLVSLSLAGNPCAVSTAYARTTLTRLPRLKWLDSREVVDTDRSEEPFEPHPDDLRSAYFHFTVIRVISVPPPPKSEKGATTGFHVELELPLLDPIRRAFLMFGRNESLIEMLPAPEDDEWPNTGPSTYFSKVNVDPEASSQQLDIYSYLETVNPREIKHFTVFESIKVQWNKIMNFQEPTIKIFCPDLVALRNTFRTVITIRLIYSVVTSVKQSKADKKSAHSFKSGGEQRVTLATIKCTLKRPDWSQNAQHFHWDDSLETDEAIHWGDGDLSALQYSQAPVKVTKGKPDTDAMPSRQTPPDNLTCHFGFGITTLHA